MKYTTGLGSSINLTQADFKASGGEGSIFIKGGKAFKIYTNPKGMIPRGKVKELHALHQPNIITPDELLSDPTGQVVGYSMRAVPASYALAEIFPRAFKDRMGATPQTIYALIKRLMDGVNHVHKNDILIVDMNELNFLVSKALDEVYFIDVDSYQTPSYKATAIMASIQDPQVVQNQFTRLSDWFSFAILSFQMWVGIHPYRGKHPTIKGLTDRMQAGVSVFNPEVSTPQSAAPLDIIPEIWRGWYKAVLEQGKRLAPPGGDMALIRVVPQFRVLGGSDNLSILDVQTYTDTVKRVWNHGRWQVVATGQVLMIRHRPVIKPGIDLSKGHVAFSTPRQNPYLLLLPTDGRADTAEVHSLLDTGEVQTLPWKVEQMESHDGRVYIKNGPQILEVHLQEVGDRSEIRPTLQVVANVLPHASRLYPGCVVQDLMGSCFVHLFTGRGMAHQVKIPELNALRIMDAKFSGGVLVVISALKGKYERHILRFDPAYLSYDLRTTSDVPLHGINFITLDSGVCVLLNEDEHLEVFSCRKGSTGVKVVKDPFLGADLHLVQDAGSVCFFRGNKTGTLKMNP